MKKAVTKRKKVQVKATSVVQKNDTVKVTEIGENLSFDQPYATVKVSLGVTKNMGNYESLRIGVDLSLPCSPVEADAAFDKAAKFVENKLNALIEEVTPQGVGVKDMNDVEL